MAGAHEEERSEGTDGGDASAKGAEDDQKCRRECWISSQNHKANDVEVRSTDPEERAGRRECAGTLRSKKKRMVKTLAMQ